MADFLENNNLGNDNNEKVGNNEEVPKDNGVKKDEKNMCIISVTNTSPYDTSEFTNSANIYYTNMTYAKLKELYYVIKNNSETENMVYKTVKQYVNDPNTDVFFDFKCSSDCNNGDSFVDNETTLMVIKLINVMTRKGCNIVVGDFSMAALFNNWNKYRMDFPSPIVVSPSTTSGEFKMTGLKEDFLASKYPILKNLGEITEGDNIDMTFSNMSGTKIYTIVPGNEERVKVISRGHELDKYNTRPVENNKLVHSEFKYRNGMIILTSNHWCNLNQVNSNVNIDKIRERYAIQCGIQECNNFEVQYSMALSTGDQTSINQVVTNSIRYLASGKKE